MGDFQANFQRPSDSGIHTVEGNLAGSRAAALEKKRGLEQEEFERKKSKIAADAHRDKQSITSKFAGGNATAQDTTFREATVGLVTAEQFRALQAAKDNPIETRRQKGKSRRKEGTRKSRAQSAQKDAQAEKETNGDSFVCWRWR